MKLNKLFNTIRQAIVISTASLVLTLTLTPSYASIPSKTPTNSTETYCLAQAIYFEARGEPFLGQIAVAQVVLNRTKDNRFPETICEVVTQTNHGCQFSYYCDGKSDILPSNQQAKTAKTIASFVLSFDAPDVTKGALFFHANYTQPTWAKRSELTIEIGNHIFYRRP